MIQRQSHKLIPAKARFKIKDIMIDIKTKDCLYITINDHVYYIDDSTGEQIVDKWRIKKREDLI